MPATKVHGRQRVPTGQCRCPPQREKKRVSYRRDRWFRFKHLTPALFFRSGRGGKASYLTGGQGRFTESCASRCPLNGRQRHREVVAGWGKKELRKSHASRSDQDSELGGGKEEKSLNLQDVPKRSPLWGSGAGFHRHLEIEGSKSTCSFG